MRRTTNSASSINSYTFNEGNGRIKQRLLTSVIAAVMTAGLSGSALAQEGEAIREIRVEGSAAGGLSDMALDVARFGTQVQAIDHQEIQTGGFTNFGELAAGLIRGANIGYSPDEGEFTIRIDGGTDRDTLLLLNGVPAFDRGTPLETIWPATSIDPRMIERVEIFRGGQSLYYGGNGGLGVVNAIYKRPEAGDEAGGEIGTYAGAFRTRELYGNATIPLGKSGNHYLMVFGRSYETDAHELFSEEAFTDNVLALGGKHDFPYSYNLAGAKYLWSIDADTEFRAGYQLASVDFRDSFPNTTVFQPNYTQFPIYDAEFKTRFNDRFSYEAEAYYTAPQLWNTEVDVRTCNIPRFSDLPADAQAAATAQGISGFSTAAEFEAFAATQTNLPAGCVTNPYGNRSGAAVAADEGYYVDENGNPYGTADNPFPIGAPMGYVIQSVAGFGSGVPTKGFGETDQFRAGYIDYGFNNRLKMTLNDQIEGVVGVQSTNYRDNSASEYGMEDDTISTTGVYVDLRATAYWLVETNFSIAFRQDFNNKFEDESIWKYGIRQELPGGFYLRSNGGTSYSNPTLTEAGMRSNTVTNPNLQPQTVETYSFGAGINGDLAMGTYNVEVGYFDTQIENLFGSAAIENVCINYPDVDELDINPNIVTPTQFCNFALDNGLARNSVAYFNRREVQDITGITVDVAFDTDHWGVDFTFTDMESLQPNSIYGQNAIEAGTGQELSFVVPGAAGSQEFRQSAERPEWSAAALISYTPNEDWIFSLNPRWQGPEWAYGNGRSSRLVDASGNRTNPDLNFGDYFVLDGSVQYFLGNDNEHRFMIRAVNILDKDYFERASASADRRVSRAGVRGEIGVNDADYYYQYGWNGKPRSFWVQYEYQF